MMSEIWGGILIALSLGAYGVDRRILGAAAAVAALVFRELALPYCLLGLTLALWQRRRNESIVYLVGLAGWAVFYAVHCWEVSQWVSPTAVAHRHSWFQFGGLRFVLVLTQASAVLVTLPSWVTVVFFALAMVGFGGWNTAWGTRMALTAAMYVAAFAIVGQEFNGYWGHMISSLMCFGVVRSRGALGDLWRAARLPWPKRRSSTVTPGEGEESPTKDTTTTSTRCPTKEEKQDETRSHDGRVATADGSRGFQPTVGKAPQRIRRVATAETVERQRTACLRASLRDANGIAHDLFRGFQPTVGDSPILFRSGHRVPMVGDD